MRIECSGTSSPDPDSMVDIIKEVINTLEPPGEPLRGLTSYVGLVGNPQFAAWWGERYKKLSNDYSDASGEFADHCGEIAWEIAEMLAGEGVDSKIVRLQGRSIDGANTESLMPLPFEGRVSWGGHTVCIGADFVYDPLLPAPEPIASYPMTAFGVEELQIVRVIPFVAP